LEKLAKNIDVSKHKSKGGGGGGGGGGGENQKINLDVVFF